MSESTVGRHRAAARYNPFSEMATVVARVGESGLKASAILAASGGMIAAVALPASATPAPTEVASPAGPASVTPAAVIAPAVSVPVRAETFGIAGITAVAKPKPKPKPKVVDLPVVRERTTTAVSRSTTRTSNRTLTTSAPKKQTVNNNIPQSASNIVNIALGLLGIPYVYGGSTPSGFDCSGFTSYVYRQAGISIPRTAEAQRRASTRVSDPKPGDLVFFGIPAHHVGIYAGNGMMIDSPHTGEVTQYRKVYSSNVTYGRF